MANNGKKKNRVPWEAVIWGTLAAAAAVRGLYRPHRALLKDGHAALCSGNSGPGCRNYITLQSFIGVAPIYAPVDGVVNTATAEGVSVAAANEPVILQFAGDVNPLVRAGDRVMAGQQIGSAAQVQFSVLALRRRTDGVMESEYLVPSAWLAARGRRISVKQHQGTKWCEQGRRLIVPRSVLACDLEFADPPGFSLLPVSVTSE